jgi:hypothetical protein
MDAYFQTFVEARDAVVPSFHPLKRRMGPLITRRKENAFAARLDARAAWLEQADLQARRVLRNPLSRGRVRYTDGEPRSGAW